MTGRFARAVAMASAVAVACTAGPPAVAPTTVDPNLAPASDPDVARVAVIGDWGAGSSAQRRVAERMCSVYDRRPFRFILTTGDNFYDPDGTATPGNYTAPASCLIARGIKWRASWGNHDLAGEDTREVLGARRRYTFTAAGIRFIVLDSNRILSDTQRTWLRDKLRAERDRPVVVAFHHSPFTVSGGHTNDPGVVARWVPLFERFDVALVLTGHSHTYEHHRRAGVDYVVTGGGGRFLHGCARVASTLRRCENQHHFLVLRIEDGRIRVTARASSGAVIDRFDVR